MYNKKKMGFDCVIPFGPNDESMINICISKARENIIDLGNIYVLSYREDFSHPEAICISEKKFPFSKDDIEKYAPKERCGWYLQQFLKLYAYKIIPELSEYFLVLDADTIFLRRISFFDKENPLYNVGEEFHPPYFKTLEKITGLAKKYIFSGITNHMIFKKEYLDKLLHLIETRTRQVFWKGILESIDPKDIWFSGFSEYETYFSFIIEYYPDNFLIRKLSSHNPNFYHEDFKQFVDYVSVHWHNRS